MAEQHTLGHIDCAACQDARRVALMSSSYISAVLVFAEAAALWLQMQSLPGNVNRARYVSPRTIKDDGQYIDALNRFFGKLRLCDIHVGHLREYQALRASGKLGVPTEDILQRCARWHRCSIEKLQAVAQWWDQAQRLLRSCQRPVGAVKINQELGLLSRILRRAGLWTQEFEECYQPLRAEVADIPRALSPDEQERFLNTAASREEWQLVYWYSLVAFETSMSNCEMRGLRLADVNLYQRVVMVRSAHAKNRYRVRTIPLTPNALWALERIAERAKAIGATEPEHYLFPFGEKRHNYDPRNPMTSSGIKRSWEAIRQAAGIKWFRIHDLRHTAITRMAENGVPIPVVMSIAGHISARMTQHYTQVSDAAKQKALLSTFASGAMKRMPLRAPAGHNYTGAARA